jgi:hypothetical protein
LSQTALSGFPETWTIPDTNSAEVQAMYGKINWNYVPSAPVRAIVNGAIDFSGYKAADPYCWWSYDNCVTPKVSYIPSDIYTCPTSGDYGLSFDDGPLSLEVTETYGEPALYNFLVENNQKATLFVSFCIFLFFFFFYIILTPIYSILVLMSLIILLLLREVSMMVTQSVPILGLINP